MTEKESRFPLQGLRKTVFAKTPTTEKIWRDFGHERGAFCSALQSVEKVRLELGFF